MSDPVEAELWRERARRFRAVQDMASADHAIAEAARLAPGDPLTAFLRAQSAYELGYPAAALFAEAVRRMVGAFETRAQKLYGTRPKA